jgi:hypothetical protein
LPEVNVHPLDLWKNVEKLTVDEFMCLLFGLEPGTVKFDYGNPKEWPENADLVYRILADDLHAKKLRVTFDYMPGDPFNNGAYDKFYAMTDDPWWAAGSDLHDVGKLRKRDLVKWLADKNIQSDFFNTTQAPTVITQQVNSAERTDQPPVQNAVTEEKPIIDEANIPGAAPQPATESETTPASAMVKKKYQRGAISALTAATILGVSQRQVQNWDAGVNRPNGYPGRRNEAAFQLFANEWKRLRLLTEQARAINRAVSTGLMINNADEDALDDL